MDVGVMVDLRYFLKADKLQNAMNHPWYIFPVSYQYQLLLSTCTSYKPIFDSASSFHILTLLFRLCLPVYRDSFCLLTQSFFWRLFLGSDTILY